MASVPPPRDALPVHRQRLVSTGEAVPRHEPAGDDGASVRGSFRAAGFCVLGHLRGPQLADATAPCIPPMVLVELVEFIILVECPCVATDQKKDYTIIFRCHLFIYIYIYHYKIGTLKKHKHITIIDDATHVGTCLPKYSFFPFVNGILEPTKITEYV